MLLLRNDYGTYPRNLDNIFNVTVASKIICPAVWLFDFAFALLYRSNIYSRNLFIDYFESAVWIKLLNSV